MSWQKVQRREANRRRSGLTKPTPKALCQPPPPHWAMERTKMHLCRHCGVHDLWFALVCFTIRSPPPPRSKGALWDKMKFTIGKNWFGRAILGTQFFRSQTPPPTPPSHSGLLHAPRSEDGVTVRASCALVRPHGCATGAPPFSLGA